MAILSKEELTNRVKDILKEDTSDTAIAFLEDFSDTIADFETKANPDGENWKQKYTELDESWRKKYTERFFEGGNPDPTPNQGKADEPDPEQEVDFVDLFKEKGK